MGNKRLSRDAALMGIADIFAQRSSCSRLQVGAIFSLEGRILSTGYNGTPAGMLHCNHTCICPPPRPSLSPEDQEDDPHLSNCPADLPCTRAVHAEANGISFAARKGVSLEGSELHVSVSPCLACAMLIVNAGVVRVTYGDEYRNLAGLQLLDGAGVQIRS